MSEVASQFDLQTLFDAALYDLAVRMRQYDALETQRTEDADRVNGYRSILKNIDRTVDLADQPAEIAYAALGHYLAQEDVRTFHPGSDKLLENRDIDLIGKQVTVDWSESSTVGATKLRRNEFGNLDSTGWSFHMRRGTIEGFHLNAATGGILYVRSGWLKHLHSLEPLISRENDYTPSYKIRVD